MVFNAFQGFILAGLVSVRFSLAQGSVASLDVKNSTVLLRGSTPRRWPLGDEDMAFPSEYRFSIHDFHSVLTSEASETFGIHRLSGSKSNELWLNAIEYEWGKLQTRRRLGTNTSVTLSPYLVCDIEEGKVGEKCHSSVESHFGPGMATIYNGYDKSCYIVSATYQVAESAPSYLVVTPLVVEGKIREGVLDEIDSRDALKGLQLIFCPGLGLDEESAKNKVTSIIDGFYEREDNKGRLLSNDSLNLQISHRFLRTDALESTRHEEMQQFWKRKLQDGIEAGLCDEFHNNIEVEIDDFDDGFTVMVPPEFQTMEFRECMHSLVAGFSLSESICSIETKPEFYALNSVAQWVTQSDQQDNRPFFDVGLDGDGEVVQVSDTGLDLDNCYFNDALNGNIAKNGRVDLTKRKVVQYVAYADSREGRSGHGTHVAGTVGGKREGANGIVDGIAPRSKIAFFDIEVTGRPSLSAPNNPSTYFNEGRSASAKIHSASWGTGFNGYSFSERAFDNYMAVYDDFLVIVSAGNSGERGAGTVGSPSTCKNGLSVGSTQNARPHITDSMRGEDYLSGFSSRGPTRDGRAKPDIMAPGHYIRSAEAREDFIGECDDTNPDALTYKSGTSMAAPVVSGTAALVRQYFQEAWYPGGRKGSGVRMNPSSALTKAVLLNGGQTLTAIQNRNGSISSSTQYDFNQRFGRINLIESLPLAGKNSINAIIVDRKSLSNNQEDTYDISIREAECRGPLTTTLVWTDPPAASGCTNCLINDLDLTVDGPGGRIYPNGRSSADTLNNAERIRIDDPVNNRSYRVTVRGANLDRSSQDYSLVVTGCFANPDEESTPQTPSPIRTPNPTPPPEPAPTGGQQQAPSVPIPSPSTCEDGKGTVQVNSVIGEKDCMWLESNKNDYPWLCSFRDVSLECPVACDVCDVFEEDSSEEVGETEIYGVQPSGQSRWHGNMFEVDFLQNIVITEFLLHIRGAGNERRVQIYMIDGAFTGKEFTASSWGNPIVDQQVASEGFGQLTSVNTNISVNGGEKKSFYFTIAGTIEDMVIINGSPAGNVIVQNEDMRIKWGKAISYPFGGTSSQSFDGYGLNGGFQYALRNGSNGCTDSSDAFYVDNVVGDQDCDWVSRNTYRFDHVCKFLAVAIKCPVTCDFCGIKRDD